MSYVYIGSMKTVVVTTRIAEVLLADLDRLAGLRERSRAWLIEKAVAAFVREELDLRLSLQEAEDEIDRGDYLTHEQFMVELKTEFAQRQAA